MNKLLLFTTWMFATVLLHAQSPNITQQSGSLESAYVKWDPVSGAESYNVYYSGGGITDKKIDTQLIRSYGNYFRADVLGLAAGTYTMKVVPVVGGVEGTASTSSAVTVLAHDRTGFAHQGGRIPGAYNMDGTLKANAVVLYITQNTKNTVSLNVTGATTNPCVGLQTILDGFKKGKDSRPLAVRFIGNITDLSYMLNGDIVIENNNLATSSITFEGIGDDAYANGWGIRIKNASNVEVRNLGFMLTDAAEGDNIGLQQGNDHIWVHNNDMFYGAAGGDADQVKGDGALDVKKSTYVTLSYNHFWDSGKANLLGLSEGTAAGLYVTYHHNWYDHSDSRHPRVRYYSAHVYNNYFDGNSKYGSGSTLGSSLFLEGNYFRNCKYPMLISMQGTDVFGGAQGTFSGEAGGMIKAFNNSMSGQQRFVAYDALNYPVEFDAYVASSRDEVVSSAIKSKLGGNVYNNFDNDPALYVSNLVVDDPETAKTKVMQFAGRVDGGDLKWTFNNATDDTSYDVNAGLKALLTGYSSSMVYVQGETPVVVSTQTLAIPSNNDQTVTSGSAIANMVFTWGGTATDATVTGLPANGITFTKDVAAKTITVSGTPSADLSFTITTSGTSGTPVSGSGNITVGAVSNESIFIHNFTTDGKLSTFYSITGNMNSTDGSNTYDGLTLTKRLKIESTTNISYTTSKTSTLTLVFDPTFAGKVKVNGTSYTVPAGANGVISIPNIPVGANAITKDAVANLYYIKTVYDNAVLATADPKKAIELAVYPNPVSNVLNIKTTEDVKQISIFNMNGGLVKSVNQKVKSINLTHLSSGIYMVKITTTNGNTTKKIIKK
ncbi:T9SS type A sorting domain-containing protein [Candidatus Kaistella beijingensis]|uniref:pectate lyase family protein n=1 Tax=Candidatus Kaistella beijingensis TaxID=2820270 RepID=UPI001CC5F71D|nr:T9SS type A sorting domain-containing protein [Candidatus Kaistella beijingensis]UBB88648.1 T9SS type A sorting domain-containing protein [Candidatus Kaistella beijingensis]